MALRNLVLDMGNVLLGWEPRAFALRAAGGETDAEALYQALFAGPEWARHDAGQISEGAVLRAALARTPARLRPAMRLLFERWPEWMPPVPGADRLMQAARAAGLRLYLLSNAGTRFPEALTARGLFPPFDGMMVSAHERLSKPDPRLYRLLCGRFGLQAADCLFVDDLAENVGAARSVGMLGHVFDGDHGKVAQRLRALGAALRWPPEA